MSSRASAWVPAKARRRTRAPTRSSWSSCASGYSSCSKSSGPCVSGPVTASPTAPKSRRCTESDDQEDDIVSAARAPRARSVPRDEFARRRQHLMKLMGKDSIAVISAAPVRLRNNDVEYAYRQDSDFHYLTGFGEPESVAVLIPGRQQAEYLLFLRDRDPTREAWDGRRAGPAGAVRTYGADDAFPITDMDEILPGLLENRTRVFYT